MKQRKQLNNAHGLNKKLAAYSAMAGAVMALPHVANADGIQYKDINPDVTLDTGIGGGAYNLDLNNDGQADFQISLAASVLHYTSWNTSYNIQWDNLKIQNLNPTNQIIDQSNPPNFGAVPYLNLNDVISSGAHWGAGSLYMGGYWNYLSGPSAPGNTTYGAWSAKSDKYIGLKLSVNPNIYFGWVRLTVAPKYATVVIKDYAFQSKPSTKIYAGHQSVTPSPCSNIVPSDISDNNDATDLQVTFDKAADETTLTDYRVICVKTADIALFNADSAVKLPPSRYVTVTPNGSANYTANFTVTKRDSKGALIVNGTQYSIAVWLRPDGFNANCDDVVVGGTTITLASAIPADKALNVMAGDSSDNNNGTDLVASFDAAGGETTVSAYRILAVKTANVGAFDLAAAETAANYKNVSILTGGPYQFDFGAAGKDVDGDNIMNGVPYSVFVLSMADGVNANVNALSLPSNSITLSSTPVPVTVDAATNVTAADSADNGNASDMHVAFSMIADEATLSEYRVVVVKSANAGAFDLAAAQALPTPNYTSIAKSGADVAQALGAGALDSDGDAIAQDTDYKVFVWSVADGTNANVDNLSGASPTVTLTMDTGGQNMGINPLDQELFDIYSSGRDVIITMDHSLPANGVVSIFNLAGQEMVRQSIDNSRIVLSLNEQTDNIYIVRISMAEGILSKKVYISGR